MTEYTDKSGATMTVERSGSFDAVEIHDAFGEVAGRAHRGAVACLRSGEV